ncbi:MAG: hypothetical protein COV52_09200 [Gammaproteobacteria bacterium CG11_big_fil_rev_8_21_14_0_20_46_22]|nr:MAG: hypothetical protein COW05_06940 [Gammaproteobacteria bacterium CG12_big_fil_rev_8_21_14_0_65_46_12]PIR10308.1 MAG: hypothetical protein COV52_09200 [Gammaproteobacteria bacterium CG11_big_fil_rev_8_21_14_0_20_46_22]
MSLAQAILFGQLEDIKPLVSEHTDLDDYDEYGYTPLIEAIIANKADMLEYLLSFKPNIEFADTTGRTPLHWAVDNENEVIVEQLLKHGANPNSYTTHSMPAGTMAYLRDNQHLLFLLKSYGLDLEFIKDYVQTKLLAHRYQLKGKVDIVSTSKRYCEVNLEGFILESTVAIIYHSFRHFVHHFAGREFHRLRDKAKTLLHAFERTMTLMKFQHYWVDPTQHRTQIESLIQQNIVLLPVAYHGHAVCFLRAGRLLAKCDRGEYGRKNASLTLYRMKPKARFDFSLINTLFFSETSEDYVHKGLNQALGLQEMIVLDMPPQITGNCSWANIEGIIPAGLFLLLSQDHEYSLEECERLSLEFFKRWQHFDQRRAVDDIIDRFFQADKNKARQASLAALLACVLFQYCNIERKDDVALAEKIGRVFQSRDYRYILRAYLDVYQRKHHKASGERFSEVLAIVGLQE